MSQLLHHSRGRTPRQSSRRPDVPETTAEQEDVVRAIAETELEQLEAQQEDVVESDSTNSSDEDYQPIPHMPPHAHDREGGGSSSAPPQPQPPQTDPALLATLEHMRQDQARQA